MCKNSRIQSEVIAAAKAMAPEVYAVFEMDGVRNLTSVIVADAERAISFSVHRYGDMEVERKVPRYRCETLRDIARAFDVDRRTSQLVPC